MSFNLLNYSTTPDEITDALLKFKIPAKISWTIGLILRQATFMIKDYQNVLEIQGQRLRKLKNRRKKFFLLISIVISNLINHSVVRSIELNQTLISRQFEGPHPTIIYNTASLKIKDIPIIFLFLPAVILLFTSSQLFIR